VEFYRGRNEQLMRLEDGPFSPFQPSQLKSRYTYPPRILEFRWDDNYQTRLLCGAAAHGHPLGINEDHLKCAMRKLVDSYTFVGIQERFGESLCLLSKRLGISYLEVNTNRIDGWLIDDDLMVMMRSCWRPKASITLTVITICLLSM